MTSRSLGKKSWCSKPVAVGLQRYLGCLSRAVQISWSRNMAFHHMKGLSAWMPGFAAFKSLDIPQIHFLCENYTFLFSATAVLTICNGGLGER